MLYITRYSNDYSNGYSQAFCEAHVRISTTLVFVSSEMMRTLSYCIRQIIFFLCKLLLQSAFIKISTERRTAKAMNIKLNDNVSGVYIFFLFSKKCQVVHIESGQRFKLSFSLFVQVCFSTLKV